MADQAVLVMQRQTLSYMVIAAYSMVSVADLCIDSIVCLSRLCNSRARL